MCSGKTAVALSGGVDSAVAAAFLKNKGLDLIGVTITLGYDNSRDIEDAAKVAQLLDIPHTVVSLEDEFNRLVRKYFIEEYHRGRTPNPCAVCNPVIKFGALFNSIKEYGADRIATGHYATVTFDTETGRYLLKKGIEAGKDQSYFLARLSQQALSNITLPVGTYTKSKIRELAARFSIPVARKKESQEACFIINESVSDFISRISTRDLTPGRIVDMRGNVLGTHKGIEQFTIGQRKGLGIAAGVPMYVVSIDRQTGDVVVGADNDLYHREFTGSGTNWICLEQLKKPMHADVKIRYMHKPRPARIMPADNGSVQVVFDTPQRAITPGQLAVMYDRDSVIGSAWIDNVV